MAPLRPLVCALALATAVTGFTSPSARQFGLPATHSARRTSSLAPLFGLAGPDTKTVVKTVTKTSETIKEEIQAKPGDPMEDYEHEFKEAPMFQLFYIADADDEEEHVTSRIGELIENIKADEAQIIYKSAQAGSAESLIGKYPKEVAELYAEQLTRSKPIIYADVRDDKASQ